VVVGSYKGNKPYNIIHAGHQAGTKDRIIVKKPGVQNEFV
jgi:hypothetical protein